VIRVTLTGKSSRLLRHQCNSPHDHSEPIGGRDPKGGNHDIRAGETCDAGRAYGVGVDDRSAGFAAGGGQYTAIQPNKGLHNDNVLSPPARGSYEEYFRACGLPNFILDLRKAVKDDPASGWLAQPRSFRSIGALAMDDQFGLVNLSRLYDAIVYLDQTSASRTLQHAIKK